MLLVMDIGNTNIVLGIYDANKLINHWRLATRVNITHDELALMLHNLFEMSGINASDINASIISCVVPPFLPMAEQVCREFLKTNPLIVAPGIKTGMPILYDNPVEVGADRIVNAVAAYYLYEAPLIVVDFGTATTFCVVSEKGEYLGGCIAPGLLISAEALYKHTAKLPRIEILKPPSVIGRSTITSIQSGIYFGHASLVDGIIARISAEINQPGSCTTSKSGSATGKGCQVIATGGLARLLSKECKEISFVNPFLTLEGLRIIYEMNSESRVKPK